MRNYERHFVTRKTTIDELDVACKRIIIVCSFFVLITEWIRIGYNEFNSPCLSVILFTTLIAPLKRSIIWKMIIEEESQYSTKTSVSIIKYHTCESAKTSLITFSFLCLGEN